VPDSAPPPAPPAPAPPAPAATGVGVPVIRPDAALAAQARTVVRLARLLERVSGDLTLSQYRVLSHLIDGDSRASVIAGRLSLTKPSVTVAVDGLVAAGFVCRRQDPADRRVTSLVPTDAGRDALARADAAYARAFGELVAELPGGPDGAAARGLGRGLAGVEAALTRRRQARRGPAGAAL
jgi:DNA-binding MarR family transcriptional regulator